MRITLGLLLAAAAAVGVYEYSKMTPEQKLHWKERGKDFTKKLAIGNLFTRKKPASTV